MEVLNTDWVLFIQVWRVWTSLLHHWLPIQVLAAELGSMIDMVPNHTQEPIFDCAFTKRASSMGCYKSA